MNGNTLPLLQLKRKTLSDMSSTDTLYTRLASFVSRTTMKLAMQESVQWVVEFFVLIAKSGTVGKSYFILFSITIVIYVTY